MTVTGSTWCEACQQHIPDVFEDHFEQHKVVSPEPSIVTREALVFWAFCVAVGVLAALAVVTTV